MFGRPLAYAVLALFVLLFSLLTLWFDDFTAAGVASLRRPLGWAVATFLVVPILAGALVLLAAIAVVVVAAVVLAALLLDRR